MSEGEEEAKAQIQAQSLKDATELSELEELLDFVQLNQEAASFFDLNGSRGIYLKFRQENSKERILHSIVHFFISLHLPQPIPFASSENTKRSVEKKSNMKRSLHGEEYKAQINEANSMAKNLRSN